LVAGNIDLSVGSVAGYPGALAAEWQVIMTAPTIIVCQCVLIVGLIIGGLRLLELPTGKNPRVYRHLQGMLVFLV